MVGIPDEPLSALLCSHPTLSFGTGTASPTTPVRRAAELGYRSVALTDSLNMTGAVEPAWAVRDAGLRALIGATRRVRPDDDHVVRLVQLATSAQAAPA